MKNNFITVCAFGSRVAAQFCILSIAYFYLDGSDYQLFLLLSFFGSFLSLFDFGLVSIATKKLSYVHFNTSESYRSVLKLIYRSALAVIVLLSIVLVLMFELLNDLELFKLNPEILLIYFIVFITNYGFSLSLNLNFSIGNVFNARKIEILKHLLNLICAAGLLYTFQNLGLYFIFVSLMNVVSIALSSVAFYMTSKKRSTGHLCRESDLLGELKRDWIKDVARSGGSEFIFKSVMFYIALQTSKSFDLGESNVLLTMIKLMDMCSILTLQVLWSNIKHISNLRINGRVFYCFCIIYAALLSSFLILAYFAIGFKEKAISLQFGTLIIFCGYFFWLWRCVSFFELITNLKNVYWQHWPSMISAVYIIIVKFSLMYFHNTDLIIELILIVPLVNLLYFLSIRSIVLRYRVTT